MGKRVSVLFGTETGNAEGCAKDLHKALRRMGVDSTLYDMDRYPRAQLPGEGLVLVVTSTFGDGDPPVNAVAMMEHVTADDAPRLDGVRFAVCALGDASYPKHCQAGKDFDRHFEALGGERVVDLQQCDVEYEVPFAGWKKRVLAYVDAHQGEFAALDADAIEAEQASGGLFAAILRFFQGLFGGGASTPAIAEQPATPAPTRSPDDEPTDVVLPPPLTAGLSKDDPLVARVVEARLLSGEGSGKETRHYTLDLGTDALPFEPGDSFGILPRNDPDEVRAILAALGLDGEAEVRDGERTRSLHDALMDRCLQTVSVSLLDRLGDQAPEAHAAAEAGDEALQAYLAHRHLVDVALEVGDAAGLTAEELLDLLRPMPPRLYSVASSRRRQPDRVDLLVETLRWEQLGRPRKGVASTWLADRREVGDEVPVYLAANVAFRLPDDGSTPLVMIGPGTGLAPFRGFLEDRERLGHTGPAWLFFGHQHEASDFLYREELEGFVDRGVLTRLDCAWSRDQDHKLYVQHLMEQAGDELFRWLQDGAVVYVCGDATRMAPDVDAALRRIVAAHHDGDPDRYVQELADSGRYVRDVY